MTADASADGLEHHLSEVENATSLVELQAALARLPADAVRTRQLALIDKTVRRLSEGGQSGGPTGFRWALLGNHTLEPLAMHCRVRHAMAGIEVCTWIGPFGQYTQALLAPDSALLEFAPDAIFLSLNSAVLGEELVAGFASLSSGAIDAARVRILGEIDGWVSTALEKTGGTLCICNFAKPAQASLGIVDSKRQDSEAAFYQSLNATLLQRYRDDRRVFLFDLDRLVAGFGAERAFSHRQYFLAKIPWTEPFTARVASELVRFSVAISGRAKKCLVLDLDNTIWGGIVGEDGRSGLRIGPGSAAGEAFQRFQWAIKGLKARGILLAICSKNNPCDVDSALSEDGRMPLRRSDFVAERINWQPKPDNMVSIANELNIGLDSMVFIDDNPVEREFVRLTLPEVTVPEWPADPADYVDALLGLPYFEQVSITREDQSKSEMYAAQTRRSASLQFSTSLEDYLVTLGSRLSVRRATRDDRDRIHQLFSKTNQFNLTTRRYSLAQVDELLSGGASELTIASLADKFGDLGIIALALTVREQERIELDSFVMSCRAMGRGVETALMNVVKGRCAGAAVAIVATYIRTPRNEPASNFLPSQGFVEVSRDGERVTYVLERPSQALISCPHIRVEVSGRD